MKFCRKICSLFLFTLLLAPASNILARESSDDRNMTGAAISLLFAGCMNYLSNNKSTQAVLSRLGFYPGEAKLSVGLVCTLIAGNNVGVKGCSRWSKTAPLAILICKIMSSLPTLTVIHHIPLLGKAIVTEQMLDSKKKDSKITQEDAEEYKRVDAQYTSSLAKGILSIAGFEAFCSPWLKSVNGTTNYASNKFNKLFYAASKKITEHA